METTGKITVKRDNGNEITLTIPVAGPLRLTWLQADKLAKMLQAASNEASAWEYEQLNAPPPSLFPGPDMSEFARWWSSFDLVTGTYVDERPLAEVPKSRL